MYIKNKSGPNTEPQETRTLILAQDEVWTLRITLCFLINKKSVKRLNKFLRARGV